MDSINDIQRLLSETPKYMSHITVSRMILEKAVEELQELKKKVEEQEKKK
jgi:hypothetical protein